MESTDQEMTMWTEKYVFFWKPPSAFDQWSACDFEVEGVRYNCAEQFMMAEKACLFGDDEMRRRILAEPGPRRQKQLGQQVRGFEEGAWQRERLGIVTRGNRAKYGQNEQLAAQLLATGDRTLVEASPMDRIWGIGLDPQSACRTPEAEWRGLNLLGRALMQVREELRTSAGQAAPAQPRCGTATVVVEAAPGAELRARGMALLTPQRLEQLLSEREWKLKRGDEEPPRPLPTVLLEAVEAELTTPDCGVEMQQLQALRYELEQECERFILRHCKESSSKYFLDAFSDSVAWRDFAQAVNICKRRLQVKPGDQFALGLHGDAQELFDMVDITIDSEGAALIPPFTEIQERAHRACVKASEAMFDFLMQDRDALMELGEQAVGIFFEQGYIAPGGPHRERLLEMCRCLLRVLRRGLEAASHIDHVPDALSDAGSSDWRERLFLVLGLLWWQAELEPGMEAELLAEARCRWGRSGGSMQVLAGWPLESLPDATVDDLFVVLMRTWELERFLVCGIFGDRAPPPLDYGIASVLAEIRRRAPVEPPVYGFMGYFYLLTHVVFVMNSYNGCLPNHYVDCPWLYDYIARCLSFWLREVAPQTPKHCSPAAARILAATSCATDAVDAIAEAVDIMLGLDEGAPEDALHRALAWLLDRQGEDGLFHPLGAPPAHVDAYDRLHPSWAAGAALQLDRTAGAGRPCGLSASWASHARAAARTAGFHEPPPRDDDGDVRMLGMPLTSAVGDRRYRVIRACLQKS